MVCAGAGSIALSASTRSRISVAVGRGTANLVTSAFTDHGLPAARVARIDASAALSALLGTGDGTSLACGFSYGAASAGARRADALTSIIRSS